MRCGKALRNEYEVTILSMLCESNSKFNTYYKKLNHSMKQHLSLMSVLIHKLRAAEVALTNEQQIQAVISSLLDSWEQIKAKMTHNESVKTFEVIPRHLKMENEHLKAGKPATDGVANVAESNSRKWQVMAPRAYHGHEEHNGDHGEVDQGLEGSMDKLEEGGGITNPNSSSMGIANPNSNDKEKLNRPFDPLVMPLWHIAYEKLTPFLRIVIFLFSLRLKLCLVFLPYSPKASGSAGSVLCSHHKTCNTDLPKRLTAFRLFGSRMPLGPMTRARAKRFKEALLAFVRTHLEGLKSIEDQLKCIEDHKPMNIPNDSKLCTLLEIVEP
ncbi:hypothetical protein CCACVL1_07554 [Corchorus capsularis]|uniref:Uncharacterized protein n=1 Tax=Corchorus capsularis TaxID=210143 RepID=A0A1R3J552_COCAP|nr:hypothetical protein CCACVL1_07554 [Corchorus capsularis]